MRGADPRIGGQVRSFPWCNMPAQCLRSRCGGSPAMNKAAVHHGGATSLTIPASLQFALRNGLALNSSCFRREESVTACKTEHSRTNGRNGRSVRAIPARRPGSPSRGRSVHPMPPSWLHSIWGVSARPAGTACAQPFAVSMQWRCCGATAYAERSARDTCGYRAIDAPARAAHERAMHPSNSDAPSAVMAQQRCASRDASAQGIAKRTRR